MREHWLVDGQLHTTHGIKDPATLERREGWVDETNGQKTHWIEFWENDELVHRSVWVGATDGE